MKSFYFVLLRLQGCCHVSLRRIKDPSWELNSVLCSTHCQVTSGSVVSKPRVWLRERTQLVKAELTTPGSLEHFMQAFHEVFQHTPILSSTCRCTLLLSGRWLTAGCHVHAAYKFCSRLVTLFIENSFAAEVWQLWVKLSTCWKSESRIWSRLVFTTLPIRLVVFCFKVFDTTHKLLCQQHQHL